MDHRDNLFERCLDSLAANINLHIDNLQYLPEYAKYRVFVRLTKQYPGIHDDDIMKSLVRPGLRIINLSTSTITDETLKILSQCQLLDRITFSEGNYKMTSEGLVSFLSYMQHLKALFITNCDVFVDVVLHCLKSKCISLTELDIGGCNVTDHGMKSLAQMKRLGSLNISRTKITDLGLKYMSNGRVVNTLWELRMSSCLITDVGIRIVSTNFPKIVTLICNNCDIKDMGASFKAWKSTMKQISWTISFDKPPLF